MTNEEFDALVRKLEEQAKINPGSYRLKVLLLAMLLVWFGHASRYSACGPLLKRALHRLQDSKGEYAAC